MANRARRGSEDEEKGRPRRYSEDGVPDSEDEDLDSDGEEFGFGAEIGISTDKLHARGPMALRELTSYKYLISGNGQTKA